MKARHALVAAAALLVLLPLVGATPASGASTYVSWTSAKVLSWVDGDTVSTSKGIVRLIGVDTPETGTCGAAKALAWAKYYAPLGSWVKLGNPASVNDRDKYGRLLRYVDRGTVDLGNRQIQKGAKARYDGRDGYQWHPRQGKYRTTDASYANYSCTTSSWGTKANSPITSANPDIDCADIPSAYKPIRITGIDYHRLDADGDGWGCES